MIPRLQLLEEANVLDGDDGLVREGLEQLDLCIAERDCLLATDVDGADRRVAAQHRDRKDTVVADRLGPLRDVRVFGAALSIGDRNHATLENRPRGDAEATGRCGIRGPNSLKALQRGTIVAGQRDHLAVEPEHETEKAITQPRRTRRDSVEHGLHVGGRARDDAQDFAGRRLLLQRHGEVAIARLELLEEAHVLDGDDGLVGEGLEQLDLAIGEGAGLGAQYRDGADGHALAHHRDEEPASPPGCSGQGPMLEFRIALHVGNMDHRALEDRSTGP